MVERNVTKKVLSTFVSMALVLGCAPAQALAEAFEADGAEDAVLLEPSVSNAEELELADTEDLVADDMATAEAEVDVEGAILEEGPAAGVELPAETEREAVADAADEATDEAAGDEDQEAADGAIEATPVSEATSVADEADADEEAAAEVTGAAESDEDALTEQATFANFPLDGAWHRHTLKKGARDTYQFTLSKAGRVRIELQNWGPGRLRWRLGNDSLTHSYLGESWIHNDNPGTGSLDRYFSAGTYTVQMYSSDSLPSYEFRGTYTAAKAAERNNATFETATTLNANTTINATFTNSGIAKHYYKISVPQAGTVTFNWEKTVPDFNPCGKLYIYDSSWHQVGGYINHYGATSRDYAAGTYYILINRGSDSGGEYSFKWSLKDNNVAHADVTGISSTYAYTGTAVKPVPTVTLDGTTLTEGKDYTLSYVNNNRITNGAAVTITGKGKYAGTKKIKFSIRFRDVATSNKFYTAVQNGAARGIVSGYNANGKATGYFGPNDQLKRCDVAVMFWHAAGNPSPRSGGKTFSDVKSSAYYYKAVRWAASVGVVNGYSGSKSGKFGPNDYVTREQLYIMLNNFARKVGGTSINTNAVVAKSGIPNSKQRATRAESAYIAYTAYLMR